MLLSVLVKYCRILWQVLSLNDIIIKCGITPTGARTLGDHNNNVKITLSLWRELNQYYCKLWTIKSIKRWIANDKR